MDPQTYAQQILVWHSLCILLFPNNLGEQHNLCSFFSFPFGFFSYFRVLSFWFITKDIGIELNNYGMSYLGLCLKPKLDLWEVRQPLGHYINKKTSYIGRETPPPKPLLCGCDITILEMNWREHSVLKIRYSLRPKIVFVLALGFMSIFK